jgi:hypothetical protein
MLYGRHFNDSNELIISQISMRSIDVLKEYYRVCYHSCYCILKATSISQTTSQGAVDDRLLYKPDGYPISAQNLTSTDMNFYMRLLC